MTETMHELIITFHREFQFLLRKNLKSSHVHYTLKRKNNIKDIIESCGVPHTEIGKILVDKEEADFAFIPFSNHQIEVSPVTPPFDTTKQSHLRPCQLPEVKFIVDLNVGKLAKLLRLLGIDAAHNPDMSDRDIAKTSKIEKRVVLSKDVEMFKRKDIVFGRYIRETDPLKQLRETVSFFGLNANINLFSRCMVCNTILRKVKKEEIVERLEPKIKRFFDDFQLCNACNKIYWKGSHYDKLLLKLQRIGIYV